MTSKSRSRHVGVQLTPRLLLCAVVGCSNRTEREKGKRFFRLPAIVTHQGDKTHELSKKRQGEWLARIKRDDLRPEKLEYVRVCSDHFVSGMPAKLYDSNNPDWAPSLKLGYNKTGTQAECSMGRYERATQRNATKRPAPTDTDSIDLEEDIIHGTPVQSVRMKVKGEYKEEIDSLQSKIKELKDEVSQLTLNEESFRDDNQKVLHYTGLSNWELLNVLFQYVKHDLKKCSILTPFQQLLSTLMRLRLGLSGEDVAYRFKVQSATISRTFMHVMEVLYVKLKRLIIWPDRDSLLKTMPMDFRVHFPKCVVIIDCFEIFLERPLPEPKPTHPTNTTTQSST